MAIEVEVCDIRSKKVLETFSNLAGEATIADVKNLFASARPKFYPNRQAYKIEERGPLLNDTVPLRELGTGKLLFKDLGPQIGWTTVFLTEYAGPLFIYLGFYSRPACIYAVGEGTHHIIAQVACGCWAFHYAKRLFETLFVHRFSKGTMPIRNLFKNCSYYWGFAGIIAYYVNHPLFTPPHSNQFYIGLAIFILGELGNFSIHLALRALRPPGTKVRRIPEPTMNPFTWLFKFVSCPNYTYEVMAWVGFSLMTQCLPVAAFTLCGFYQMTVWAFGKHQAYRREFIKDYPRSRRAIIPFVL